MSKKMKTTIIICLILFVVGIILTGFSLASGGMNELSKIANSKFNLAIETNEIKFKTEKYKTIDKIDIENANMNISFVETDEDYVRVDCSYDEGLGGIDCSKEGKTLIINGEKKNRYSLYNNHQKKHYVKIYVPRESHLKEIKCTSYNRISMASINVDNIECYYTGNVVLDDVKVKSIITTDDLEMTNVKTRDLLIRVVNNTDPSIKITGELLGKTKIEGDYYDLDILTIGNEDKYGYIVKDSEENYKSNTDAKNIIEVIGYNSVEFVYNNR